MIEVKLGMLLSTQEFLREITGMKLKAKDAFRFMSMYKQVISHIENYNEAKKKLVTEYGTQTENGFEVLETSEHYQKIVTELRELEDETIKLDFDKLSPDALGDLEIEVYKIFALSYIFE